MPERARFFVRIRAIAAQVILLRYYQDAMARRRAEGRVLASARTPSAKPGYKEGGENEDASLRIAPYFYINIYFV